jgi:23S rRNA (adenine2503-C2)-methyltransferase
MILKDVFGMRLEELQQILAEFRLPKFRAKQVAEWLYVRGASSFEDMTNLPKNAREELASSLMIGRPRLKTRLDSADGHTTKFLLEFADGTAVESVLMRQPYGNSICVSTQAGCNMGCVFCASTLHGMARNLTTGEITGQAVYINDMLKKEGGGKVDTVVIMGSGEPLMNYDNVLGFVRLLHEEYVLGLGYRNFTLSTSGIVPNMYRLAEEGLPISLSLSLHAPNEELRSKIMPINRKYHLPEVMMAAKNYAEVTNRRVTYEYILIDQLNDNEREAEQLAELLKGQLASVNLIPINPVKERSLLRPSQTRIEAFENHLRARHINVTVRKEMGTDIQAACGQLRNKHLQE